MESIQELRKKCQKDNLNPYRLISIYVTKMLLYTPITANQVTIMFIVVGATGVWLFTYGDYWMNVAAAVLFFCYTILDFVDGEVARYRQKFSRGGAFLDEFGHALLNVAVFAGISVGLYRQVQDTRIFWLGLLVVVLLGAIYATLSNKLFVLYDNEPIGLYGSHESYASAATGRKQFMYFRSLVRNPRFWTRSNFLWFFWTSQGIAHLVLLSTLINMTWALLVLYAVVAPIYLIWIVCLNFRELSHAKGN